MTAARWRPALALQAIAGQASWVGVRLMVGYRALELGADASVLGLLAAAFSLPALLAAVLVGRVTDRLGGSGTAITGLVTAGTGTAAALLLPGTAALLTGALVIGLGHLMVMVGQQTFVANVSVGRSSDAAFGTLTAAASVGQLIGPPAVTVAASLAAADGGPPDTTVGLLVCLGFVVLALPAYGFLRPIDRGLRTARPAAGPAPARARDLLRTPGLWRSLAVSGAVLVTVDLMYAFVPVWATEQGVGVTTVGALLALRAAVSVVSRVGLARLVDRFGRRALIIVSVLAAALALAALPFVGAPGAVLVMIALGLGLGLPQPLTMAWVTSLTPPRSHGTALGLRLTSNRLAQFTLPLAVGTFLGPMGVVGIFWANAVLLLGAVAVMVRRPPPTGEV